MALERNKDVSLLRNESHEDSSIKTVLEIKVSASIVVIFAFKVLKYNFSLKEKNVSLPRADKLFWQCLDSRDLREFW